MAIDRTLFPKLGFSMMRLPRLEGGAVVATQTKNMCGIIDLIAEAAEKFE
ncbi:MAG: hypothetical protein J5969_08740 [Lachnospiraceae bacterium]|nr:hypothetical protein [Lachnospiraceae bacterium]